jgi:hypothetical protein
VCPQPARIPRNLRTPPPTFPDAARRGAQLWVPAGQPHTNYSPRRAGFTRKGAGRNGSGRCRGLPRKPRPPLDGTWTAGRCLVNWPDGVRFSLARRQQSLIATLPECRGKGRPCPGKALLGEKMQNSCKFRPLGVPQALDLVCGAALCLSPSPQVRTPSPHPSAPFQRASQCNARLRFARHFRQAVNALFRGFIPSSRGLAPSPSGGPRNLPRDVGCQFPLKTSRRHPLPIHRPCRERGKAPSPGIGRGGPEGLRFTEGALSGGRRGRDPADTPPPSVGKKGGVP